MPCMIMDYKIHFDVTLVCMTYKFDIVGTYIWHDAFVVVMCCCCVYTVCCIVVNSTYFVYWFSLILPDTCMFTSLYQWHLLYPGTYLTRLNQEFRFQHTGCILTLLVMLFNLGYQSNRGLTCYSSVVYKD